MLLFCDGFDCYSETADLVKHKWHKYNLYQDDHPDIPSADKMGDWEWNGTEGVNGGGCIRHIGADIGDEMGMQFSYYPREWSGRSQYRTLFWFKIAEPPATRELLCRWTQVDSWGDFRISLQLFINPDGTFEFVSGEDYAQFDPAVVYTNTFNVCDNDWHCMELNADFIVPRSFHLAIDDNMLFDGPVNIAGIFGAKLLTFYSLGVDMWIDDVIVWDEAGDDPVLMPWGEMTDGRADEFIWDWYNEQPVNGDLNNFPERGQDDFFYWMGMRQITTLRPASDGTINDFDVVGAGTKIDAVDDAIPTDGKFLTENQPGARMVFNLDDFTFDKPVYSVVVNVLTVMADYGSIVAHAEALNAPDFALGIRRRISGRYEVKPNGINLITNPGPDFVDLTGWTVHNINEDIDVYIDGGKLRMDKLVATANTPPRSFVEMPIPVTPNSLVRITAQRPPTSPGEGGLVLRAGLTVGVGWDDWDGGGGSYDFLTVQGHLTNTTTVSKIWYIPQGVTEISLQIGWNSGQHILGYARLNWMTLETLNPAWAYRYYQWAFRYNPATDLEWDQASINLAEFGMRIAP
jgi:hypothetical protein